MHARLLLPGTLRHTRIVHHAAYSSEITVALTPDALGSVAAASHWAREAFVWVLSNTTNVRQAEGDEQQRGCHKDDWHRGRLWQGWGWVTRDTRE